jgi:prevent-host-death family protein
MATYNLAQAKDRLSKLVDEALSGELVTITRHGKPVVHITPAQPTTGGRALSKETLDWLAQERAKLPSLEGTTWAEIVREMRDEG